MAETRAFFLLLLFGPGNKASHGEEERGVGRRRWEEKKEKERGERERQGKEKREKRRKQPCREECEQRWPWGGWGREKGAKRYSQNKNGEVRRRHPTWNFFTNSSMLILTLSFLQWHWVAFFPNSIHRREAKLVDSAQLRPWLKPAW